MPTSVQLVFLTLTITGSARKALDTRLITSIS